MYRTCKEVSIESSAPVLSERRTRSRASLPASLEPTTKLRSCTCSDFRNTCTTYAVVIEPLKMSEWNRVESPLFSKAVTSTTMLHTVFTGPRKATSCTHNKFAHPGTRDDLTATPRNNCTKLDIQRSHTIICYAAYLAPVFSILDISSATLASMRSSASFSNFLRSVSKSCSFHSEGALQAGSAASAVWRTIPNLGKERNNEAHQLDKLNLSAMRFTRTITRSRHLIIQSQTRNEEHPQQSNSPIPP